MVDNDVYSVPSWNFNAEEFFFCFQSVETVVSLKRFNKQEGETGLIFFNDKRCCSFQSRVPVDQMILRQTTSHHQTKTMNDSLLRMMMAMILTNLILYCLVSDNFFSLQISERLISFQKFWQPRLIDFLLLVKSLYI